MEDRIGVAAFRSRQQVMNFDDALKRAGLNTRIISTPRDVAIGCGLSVEFSLRDLDAVRLALSRTHPGNLIGLYALDRTAGARPRLTALTREM